MGAKRIHRRKLMAALFWVCAALSVVWLLLFGFSFYKKVSYWLPSPAGRVLRVEWGVLQYGSGTGLGPGFYIDPAHGFLVSTLDIFVPQLVFRSIAAGIRNYFAFSVPLWIPAVPFGVAAWVFRRNLNWYRPGGCRQCSYQLFGNRSGICPECGTPIPQDQQQELVKADEPQGASDELPQVSAQAIQAKPRSWMLSTAIFLIVFVLMLYSSPFILVFLCKSIWGDNFIKDVGYSEDTNAMLLAAGVLLSSYAVARISFHLFRHGMSRSG